MVPRLETTWCRLISFNKRLHYNMIWYWLMIWICMTQYNTIVLSPGGENVCNFIPGTLSCSCRSNQSVINKVLQNNRTLNKRDASFNFSGLDAIFVLFLCSSSRIQSFLLDRLTNQQVQCWYANHLWTFKMAQSSHLERPKKVLCQNMKPSK